MILLDTNILIEIFKGNLDVIVPVQKNGPENFALSSVTAMELYYGALNKLELQRIKKYLAAFHCLHISTAISATAGSLRCTVAPCYYLPHAFLCVFAGVFYVLPQSVKLPAPMFLFD